MAACSTRRSLAIKGTPPLKTTLKGHSRSWCITCPQAAVQQLKVSTHLYNHTYCTCDISLSLSLTHTLIAMGCYATFAGWGSWAAGKELQERKSDGKTQQKISLCKTMYVIALTSTYLHNEEKLVLKTQLKGSLITKKRWLFHSKGGLWL